MISRAFIIACLFSLTVATPLARSNNLVVHEARSKLPAGFVQSGAADKDTVLKLRAGLVNSNIAGLEKELFAVSTPGSNRYGQHLTKEQVAEYVKPTSETLSLVNDWFHENGISTSSISPAGDWLEFSIPVSKANELLGADFQTFTHTPSGMQSVRTMSYSIPANLKGHIDLIHPTTTLAVPWTLPVTASEISSNLTRRASCDSSITPSCLQDLYGIPSAPASVASNTLGVSGFSKQFAIKADLEHDLRFANHHGGLDTQTKPGIEANLDIQYTIGLATDVPVTFISVGTTGNGGDFATELLDLANALIGEGNPPQTLTTSYGVNEDTIGSSAANSVCNAFMQLGAMGTSILFASGDGGVAGGHGVSCTTFVPVFPGGCPYLTSVGATTGTSETAATFSSGGFSDIFDQPSYQSDAVSSYLNTLGNTNSGLYNAGGRGFPDVSFQGENFAVISNGKTKSVAGTSCASPSFASVIALLNDQLAAAGKSPLGFLNPWLYANAGALNDITSGDNPGCGTNGFPAASGWDPVTGLGTPNFSALKSAAGL